MNNRKGPIGLLVAVPLLLTGCATADAANGHDASATSMATSRSTPPSPNMSPGMSMAPGATMKSMTSTPAASPADALVNDAGPSASARMICGSETRRNVTTLTALRTPPPTKATWADHVYTCSYQLPAGPLVLSVKESPDVPAARRYFNALRAGLGRTQPLTGLAGLGLPAYENTTGKVVFLKDNMTLEVNATALPGQVGPQHTSPADLAYTVATGVLACWTGK